MPCIAIGKSGCVGALIDALPLAASSSISDTPTRTISVSVEVGGETINPNAQSHSLAPVPTLAESSSTAPTPGTSTSALDLQTSEGNVVVIHSASNTISPLAIETQLGLNSGTQTITANPKSQNIFYSSQTLSSGSGTPSATAEVQPSSIKTTPVNGPSISTADAKSTSPPALKMDPAVISQNDLIPQIPENGQPLTLGSTNNVGSGISTTTPSLQIPGFQTPLISGSSTSQTLPATVTPALSELSTILTDGGNAVTSKKFGHFSINDQTLTPGVAITASGTLISLTPYQSNTVVGTQTASLGANFTGGIASVPKATGAQTFKGDALGARGDLCNSSTVMLVGIAILLWLR